jgi:diguanylate cyclase (GGDEF)-like protein
MIDPRTLAALGGVLVLFLTLLSGLMTDTIKAPLWNYQIQVYAWVMAVLFAFVGGSFWIINYRFYNTRQTCRNLEQQLKNAAQQLAQSDRLRFIDVVTGIPNQCKLEADFERLSRQTQKISLIMLDLDGFGAINTWFGYEKGDEVIRYIASETYMAMRRDEDIYKVPYSVKSGLWQRIYRKYTGGDEFIFVLSGDEAAALGYLVRLKRRFDSQLGHHISDNILGCSWQLRFHAGVCPLQAGDSFKDAMDRVERCLCIAKQTGSTTRVYWISRKTAADFPVDSVASRLYADAEEAFRSPIV